ncbi:MAG: hypothetical protein R3F59_29930 [Myxococcota bacterium]
MYRALRVDKGRRPGGHARRPRRRARPAGGADALRRPGDLRARAERLADTLRAAGCDVAVVEAASVAGGGALPETPLPSAAVRVPVRSPDERARALRTGDPPVVARIEDGALLLDLRTVTDDQTEVLAQRVASVVLPQ